MDKVLLNEQLKKIVIKQHCKHLIDKFETELERKKLFKKTITEKIK
jgi:hypothetical protein